LFLQRQFQSDDAGREEDSDAALSRLGRELKGTFLFLIALFFLVSFISYLPSDSISLNERAWGEVANLGGIVGAFLGKWFLGTVGLPGYAAVALLLWFSICAFRGIAIGSSFLKTVGVLLGTLLFASALYLTLWGRYDDPLVTGGWVGRYIGFFLEQYFNKPGALLWVSGGLLITLFLTTGLTPSSFFESLASQSSDEDEEDSAPRPERPAKVIPLKPAAAPAAPAKKRRGKKKASQNAAAEEGGESESPVEGEAGTLENGEAPGTSEDGSLEFEEMIPYSGGYNLPSLRLLKNASGNGKKLSRGEMRTNAARLCEHLLSFQITGEVTEIHQGPVLTTYEYRPSAGIKLSKIANLQDDLGIVMGTNQLRVIAPIPGKTVVGIEVPRPSVDMIPLKEVLSEKEFYDKKIRLPVALGKSTTGKPVFADLAAMPHLLVAGSTGSGKSVFVNSLITSFLYRLTPQQLRLILVDPKMLELSVFDGIPHLLTPVITDNKIAIKAIHWAVLEMDRRYALMAKTNSKNIDSYNEKMKSAVDKLPFIVVIVDELADLMMSGGQEVEIDITRLAQKARAAGIHLVIATQRPSTDVVTGLIKANIPSRLAFKVPSGVDSRTVLDTSGAEDLIGKGDSLMVRPGVPLQRLHGTFVTEDELARVVKNVKNGKNYSHFYIKFS
jgi:S-DNA-T family DNA segregation ATPase FtsK/SpoIIIE